MSSTARLRGMEARGLSQIVCKRSIRIAPHNSSSASSPPQPMPPPRQSRSQPPYIWITWHITIIIHGLNGASSCCKLVEIVHAKAEVVENFAKLDTLHKLGREQGGEYEN